MEKYIESFGALESKIDIQSYSAACVACCATDFPKEFELEMCDVKNQGSVGSCVAHSVSEVIEYYNKLQEGNYVKFSTGYIYGNRRYSTNTGAGMYVDMALKTAVKWGDVPNSLFNVNVEMPDAKERFETSAFELAPEAYPNRLSSYFILTDKNSIKANLMQNGPVVFYMPWYSDYSVLNGVLTRYNPDSTETCGSHCMVIYGWNKDGWKFQNSWGTSWGNKGRAILPYETSIVAYGVTDTISETLRKNKEVELTTNIFKLKQEISEKEKCVLDLTAKVVDYEALVAENNKKLTDALTKINTLTEQLKSGENVNEEIIKLTEELNALEEVNTKLLTELSALQNNKAELLNEIVKAHETIDTQSKEIEKLNKQLLDIKRPYENLPKILVKVVNFIVNLFKKKK